MKIKKGVKITIIIILVILVAVCVYMISSKKLINRNISLEQLVESLNIDTKDIEIWIDKSDRILTLKANDIKIKSYPIVLV